MIKIGDPAPDCELLTDDNTPLRLSDLRGRRIVLFFFPRADTPGCTKQACGFRDRFPRVKSAEATLLGLSPDEPEVLAKWKAKEHLPYTLLSDPDHAVADAYGAWGEKSLYGKTYMGILRGHAIIGPDGRIEDLRLRIKPEESVESAIRAIKTRDQKLACIVIDGDTKIDQMEVEIEEECLHTLALYNPVANDLRFVVSVLKINGDLERIADKAVNIAEQVNNLIENPLTEIIPFDFLSQSERVRAMLKKSLDALVNADAETAEWVRRTDDQVDKVHREMGRAVKQAIREHPEHVDALLTMWSLSRQLERIADHAVNIAEDVIYMINGDILRHGRDAGSAK